MHSHFKWLYVFINKEWLITDKIQSSDHDKFKVSIR